MERKFISIDALKKVLSQKEMKNVLGGSEGMCTAHCAGGPDISMPYKTCYEVGDQCGTNYWCSGNCL